jgi:uncharacterized protein YrrD
LSGYALAEVERTLNQNDVPTYSAEEVKEGLEDTKDAVSGTAEDVSQKVKGAYEDVKSAVIGDDVFAISPVNIDQSMTAYGMIGQPVYDQNGKIIATIKDIIVNKGGKAEMAILGDDTWFGLGKLAAFDFSMIISTNIDGNIIATLTKEMINNAASFSYERSKESATVKVVPLNGYSVSELLGSKLVNPEGQQLAIIDNISFRDGKADQLVVTFDQVLGMGGKKAAMSFGTIDLINNNGKPSFRLDAAQTKQFETYKQKATN